MATVGRRPRPGIERIRTFIWAKSVAVAAKRSLNELEPILGNDGRWNGLWSRYARGSVSPSPDRVIRIGRVLPGTARYYFSAIWPLVANREFRRSDLRVAIDYLDKRLQSSFIARDKSADGLFWRTDVSLPALLDMAICLIGDSRLGLDAVTMILILIREAELKQDGASYLLAMKAWAQLEYRREQHMVLRLLPDSILDYVAHPLRHMRFAQADVRKLWDAHVERYCKKKFDDRNGFELIDCLNSAEPSLDIEKFFVET